MRGMRAGTHGFGLEWANSRGLQDGAEKRRNGAPPSVKIPMSRRQVWDTLIPGADMSILLVSWSTDESVTQIFLSFLFFQIKPKSILSCWLLHVWDSQPSRDVTTVRSTVHSKQLTEGIRMISHTECPIELCSGLR